MYKYTIAFIKRGNEILLLNREKSQWMGCWNGVGGKIENDETPRQCILREVEEETGIVLMDVAFRGIVTWEVDRTQMGGMYVFLAEVPDTFEYSTPLKNREGILDWKTVEWICHPDNRGTANLHYFLPHILKEDQCYDYQFTYEGYDVKHFAIQPILEEQVTTRN